MYRLKDIKTIHLEITQKCQAACPMCDRNMNGGDDNPHIDLSELTLEDCIKIFPPYIIKQLKTMFMCGNLGDPIIARDTLEIFEYFRHHNSDIWLSMNTNGGARDSEWWRKLAKTFGQKGAVIFSVDGLSDTNHKYRQNVDWNAVENSMRSFILAGGRARWDFLIFEHNEHQIEQAKKLSKEIGFESFQTKKTARFVTSKTDPKNTHQAVNKKGEATTALKKPTKQYQNPALVKQNQIIEKYGSMDSYYDVVPIKCKVKEEGSLFITAEGLAMPCCWTAGRMYKWWHKNPRVEQIWRFIEKSGDKAGIDARQGLEKVFETGIFDAIESSWTKNDCSAGKLKVCSMKCGIEWDPFREQFE